MRTSAFHRGRVWLAALGFLCLPALPARAAAPLVLDDFENGVSAWQRVEGARAADQKALVTCTPAAAARFGQGCARLRFAACPESWAHMQMPVVASEWLGAGCDRLGFWIRGDGSGETLNVMLGNYERKPPLSFRSSIRLDFTGWREIALPFSSFTPEGLAGALREIVLLQVNVTQTRKPIDILIDEISALPAERVGSGGSFSDLDLQSAGAWDTPSPAAPVVIDRLGGMTGGSVLPRNVHGTRNHADLHNPVEFAVDYAEAGTFAARIGDTSGYGGSCLVLSLDGKEVLRQDFPGTSETVLKQYQGWYSIPVPAGKHRIRVDNDGADWYIVESYRFGNYGGVSARVRRDDGALEVRFALPEDARGVSLQARLAGRPLALRPAGDGVFVAPAPTGRFRAGIYPVTILATRAGQTIFRRELKMRLSVPRLRAVRVAFPAPEAVDFAVRYSNAADVPVPGHKLRLRVGQRALALADRGEGIYGANLGRLPAGSHEALLSVDGAAPVPVKFVVYDPAAQPWQREGIIRLGSDGRFHTRDGSAFTPWGFATIGVFAPDPEIIQSPPGESAWCRADDQVVRDWIALLRAYGVNCVRFGVNVDSGRIGGDRGGHLDPFIGERLRHFLDLIGPLGVRAIPVMWWGHYHNFNFGGIPAYDALIKQQADWFTNPQALALQQQYVREVVAPFKNDPRILSWEVMNETYRAGSDLAAAVRWTNAITATIREVDPVHLITTSAAEATPEPQVRWMRGLKLDFFNWHAYPTYTDYSSYRKAAGEDAPREIGTYAAAIALAQRLGGLPSILGETGNDRMREVAYPEFRALITRDCLWLAFLCGSPGGISWDAIADPREFEVLSHLAARIDWNRFRAASAPAAVRVTDPEQQLGDLARYSAWSLRTGVPLQFLRPEEKAAPGQTLLPARFARPAGALSRQAPVQVSAGYESKSLVSADGRVLLAYVRNVGEILPQNVRTRAPRDLRLTVRPARPARVEIWDLDTRARVWQAQGQKEITFTRAGTDHDYAILEIADR